MSSSPLVVLFMLGVGIYVAHLWWTDLQAHRQGKPTSGGLPGARPTRSTAMVIAVVGSLVILAGETWGEIHLGLTAEQSEITVLFGCYTLVAAVIEEIIFRGFIVVPEARGRAAVWGGVFGASIVFALIHPFLWEWDDGTLTWTLGAKGWFSTGAVFASSLWFYTVRFMPANPSRSLLPCFAAHAAKNLGVFAIKAAQGFVVGLW
ncbi:CPBP family glutamic-type intramembrane protease [Synoicihabitans lomoniglobus]|uniref:CPBP family glutamic-type intramembrane protease n=1 Tax=Synoicihabitans lomoniglobus TaxID=2909285 RepID=A0AAF0CP55_9BACT|nr:CPBP family glutamic-type intramembrane protease [Opitutaceae bacterium LMO-M01]WED65465.1 CPBP family glutamic-type intramembrane protease [Opitutaceae bacterium LMO-M01]